MNLGLHQWSKRFQREGLTPSVRLELRELLTPRVVLSAPIRWKEGGDDVHSATATVRELVNWEIVLTADDVHNFLKRLRQDPRWQEEIVKFLFDATNLLLEALDLMRDLGGADERSDLSYMSQPSISPHPQNRDYRDWTTLIDLTREAWLATAAHSPERARSEVERWLSIHYPLFRRLVFFAASETQLFAPQLALNWLLSDGSWWLWSVETEHESLRLLAVLAPQLTSAEQSLLFKAILGGPPKEMFRDDIELESFQRISDREIWLRLIKCTASGVVLPPEASRKLAILATQYPAWRLSEDGSDEFPVWMGDGLQRTTQTTPIMRRELESWLQDNPASNFWKNSDWADRCRADFPRVATALIHLAVQGQWPVDRWRTALQIWSEEARSAKTWRYLHSILLLAPDHVLKELRDTISWFLQATAKTITKYESDFFSLIHRVLASSRTEQPKFDNDIMFQAINHPVGHVTDATFRWWYRQKLAENQRLSPKVRAVFTEVADSQIVIFRHGRVLLGANVISLFRVDQKWTEDNVLPLFEWKSDHHEALAVWTGFLWSPRLYLPLLEALKAPFIDTASHYDQLGDCRGQYAAFLAYTALEQTGVISPKELAHATSQLPADGLRHTSRTLVQALEAAGDQRANNWRNRILPYLRSIWPKSSQARTRGVTNDFARLCIASGDAFPEAVSELKHWLGVVSDPDYIIHTFHEAKLVDRFPLESLDFFDLVIGGNSFLPMVQELKESLDKIRTARPETLQDPRFQRLQTNVRQQGSG